MSDKPLVAIAQPPQEGAGAAVTGVGVALPEGSDCVTSMTELSLERENVRHRGTGGVSAKNRSLGFAPAFIDRETRAIYLSRFADGRPAPCHLLDGLPHALVLSRRACGRVAAVKPSLVSGFVRDGRFYTREEAAQDARRHAS
jgi:hypothetical protein